MHPALKYVVAVLGGMFLGSVVNMGLIMVSGSIIAPPEGVDMTTMEGLKASMHLLAPKHFIMPFLAHALGTFAGALIAGVLAPKYKMGFALFIGLMFLAGGITNVFLLPAPTWFVAIDLVVAYLPFAYFAGKITQKRKK